MEERGPGVAWQASLLDAEADAGAAPDAGRLLFSTPRRVRALRLRPWTLAVEERLGDRWIPVERHQVKGLTAARRRRGELRSRLG